MTTHDEETATPAPTPPRRPVSWGRRAGIAIFWMSAAYVVGGATLSVLPALYWPAHAPRPADPGVVECARTIDALERELAAHAAEAVTETHREPHGAWLSRWDQRYQTLGADCGVLEDARRDLGTLRADMGAWLVEHEQDTRPVRERVRRAVDAFLTADAPGKS